MRKTPRTDERYMRECLRLAVKGRGLTSPNPMVGALVVKNDRIIARGYHQRFGAPHAEIEALERAGKRAKGATLYVNLEPCAHFGKTPPCADAIIRAGVSRVVCAARDPNRLAGRGIERLHRAGIKVFVAVLEKEARALNGTFYAFHEKRRPLVVLKFAASLDGKLATRVGDSKWLTSEKARSCARALRGKYQAVLVGIGTVLADDPQLTARAKGLREPMRIVLDSRLRIPFSARAISNERLRKSFIIATTSAAPKRKKITLEKLGAKVIICGREHVSIPRLLATLYRMNIQSVLVEGGGAVLGSFLDAGTVDKIYVFYAPLLIGGEKATTIGGRGAQRLADALRLEGVSTRCLDDTVLLEASIPKQTD